jgi:hypothetical protein
VRQGGFIAISIAATDDIAPRERLGVAREPMLVVVYSAERGIIISGYQASSPSKVSIPGDALWLKEQFDPTSRLALTTTWRTSPT